MIDTALLQAPRTRAVGSLRGVEEHNRAAAAEPRCSFVQLRERQLLSMRRRFHATGGLPSSDEVTRLMRRHGQQPISRLARWIVDRQVLALVWHGDWLVPLFQFDRHVMRPWPGVAAVCSELGDVFDAWELLLWFGEPNEWLGGRAPCQAVAARPAEAVQAARADRFVALG